LNVSTTNGGHYSVVITNMFGGVTSQVAMLIVDGYGGVSSPVILTNPANKSVNLGGSATFSVVADGTPPLSYQWQSVVTNQPGVDFPDATNTSYTVNNAQETDAHSYRVVITNLGGTVTSSIATLTVRLPPAITNQPVDVTTNIGATVLLSVSATGFAPLTYRWWFNDTNLVSTSNTVRLVNVSTNNAGTFFAIVTNVAGAATSQVATLSVIDDGSEPVIAPVILTNPQNQTVNLGDAAIFSVAASGTPPLSYQWQFIVTNQPLTSLPNATNSSHAVNYALAADAGNYRVVVTNAGGAVTSSFASLTVRLPPAITNQPVGVTTNVGATVRFVVGASGSGPLNYHWFFGTTSIAGNSSSLLLSNVQTNQAGNYFVVVTNFLGSATSHVAALDLFYLPSQTPAQIFASLHPGGSLLYLTVAFEAGKNYRIQTSTNMATWEDLTNFVSTAPIMEFTNALAPNVNQMYFRLVSP